MRRVIREPEFTHGANGYRMGCGCPSCTEAHRARSEAYKAKKRKEGHVAPLRPVLDARGADSANSGPSWAMGALETKVGAALAEIDVAGAEAELLRAQALMAAKLVDEAVASGRPHHVAPANRILNEALDRLKALKEEGARATGEFFEGDEWLDSFAKGFPGQRN